MKKILALTFSMLIVAAGLEAPVFAQDVIDDFVVFTDAAPVVGMDDLGGIYSTNPYWIESRCEFNNGAAALDPSANGNAHVCAREANKDRCEKHWYCWWRDTTNQNAISQQTVDEFPDQIVSLYNSPTLNVYDYLSPYASNIIVITTPRNYMIVGCGGGTNEATYAKSHMASLLAGKTLRGIVTPDVNPETILGCRVWTKGQTYAVLYADALFDEQMQERFFVETELTERLQRMYGTYLSWGTDEFLGIGFGKESRAVPPQPWTYPNVLISEKTDITLDGNTIELIPVTAGEGVLMVHLPTPKILIASFIGKYLPDAGFLTHPMRSSVTSWCGTLDYIRTLSPSILATLHTRPIIGASEVLSAILTQRDSLQYIRDQTLIKVNQHMSLDDMVATIELPASLAYSPYAAPLTSNVPSIVRAVYHYYMGWFDGNPAHLQSLASYAHARRLIDLAGGQSQALKYIQKCVTEHTQEGLIFALEVIDALEQVSPSEALHDLHIQTLKMLAFNAESAYLRNYYLSAIQDLESSAITTITTAP